MTYKIGLLNRIYDMGVADEIEMQRIAKLPEKELQEIIDRQEAREDWAYDEWRDMELEQEQADRS